jgi:hypothetical protein
MNNIYLDTPILFIIFAREDSARLVFDEIKKIKPKKLYVAADGPKTGQQDEAQKCQRVRSIIDEVDWDCQVKTLFRKDNIGCKKAVSAAIDWFFENEEEGIILEDDCLPNQSFFTFCSEMLKYYRYDSRIMQINGCNFQKDFKRGDSSYYFSRFNHGWGWASWRRAWKNFDLEMTTFPEFKKQKKIQDIFSNYFVQKYWIKHFSKIHSGIGEDWDAQWTYAIFANSGLCVTPNVNLIKNIGFGEGAVHTTKTDHKFANMKQDEIFEIKHSRFVISDKMADDFINSEFGYTFKSRIIRELKRVFEK